MMNAATIEDVRRAFEHLRDEVTNAGILPDGELRLREGSRKYGYAWRIVWTNRTPTDHAGRGAESSPPSPVPSFIGMTKQEAFDTLINARWSVFELARTCEETARSIAALTPQQFETFRVLIADGTPQREAVQLAAHL